jgi:His-Xaa-Ser system radical SAM maturase HxsB
MTALRAPFLPRSEFRAPPDYRLLPFRFLSLDNDRYVATNEVGQYVVMSRDELQAFASHAFEPETALFKTLRARHFLLDAGSRAAVDLLALKYRTRAERLSWFTGLHIFVVTLRCDHSCHYCQVSRQTEDRANFDMTRSHADKALEFAFRSPSPNIKLEFQGGEPLLNFELIQYVVERAVQLNAAASKNVAFVIASNLSRLTPDILEFCREHEIHLSTSLDGPEDLHEVQRPLRDGHSYATTIDSLQRARAVLGHDAVSALMTTTPASLARVEEIVDEYVRRGFRSIFLRNLSPYGFAARSLIRRYDVDDWVAFYKRGLSHVLDLNRRGYPMREELTSILLQKIFSPSGASYVDLQSPAGIGIGAIVYNYDGAIYASDEGRMLAEMDDDSFRLGHLDNDSFESVMTSDTLLSALSDTMLEGSPMCSDCAFLPYCGADPVFHKATQGDVVGHKAFSAFCKRQMALLRHLISLLEDDAGSREILLGWV